MLWRKIRKGSERIGSSPVLPEKEGIPADFGENFTEEAEESGRVPIVRLRPAVAFCEVGVFQIEEALRLNFIEPDHSSDVLAFKQILKSRKTGFRCLFGFHKKGKIK
ncbi:hypothetical protein HY493_04380 [Candidatus Woesearchaeota archaeon]|nr:hypothetical protein [Candidatus Woesearchaeota archaeon]